LKEISNCGPHRLPIWQYDDILLLKMNREGTRADLYE